MKGGVSIRSPGRSLGLACRRRLLSWFWRQRSDRALERFAVIPGDAISDEIAISGLYEELILVALFEELFASRRTVFSESIALDVGANIGNHSLFFARYFKNVFAFEPNPTALAILECNLRLAGKVDKVTVFPFGLGEVEDQQRFFENDQNNLGYSGFGFAGNHGKECVQREIRRGDDVLAVKVLNSPVALIKVDVEGAELSVLRGLVDTIQRDRPVVLFESLRAGGDSGGRNVARFLRDLGYTSLTAVEEVAERYPAALKCCTRLIWGERARFLPLAELEDRKYQMIVGTSG